MQTSHIVANKYSENDQLMAAGCWNAGSKMNLAPGKSIGNNANPFPRASDFPFTRNKTHTKTSLNCSFVSIVGNFEMTEDT